MRTFRASPNRLVIKMTFRPFSSISFIETCKLRYNSVNLPQSSTVRGKIGPQMVISIRIHYTCTVTKINTFLHCVRNVSLPLFAKTLFKQCKYHFFLILQVVTRILMKIKLIVYKCRHENLTRLPVHLSCSIVIYFNLIKFPTCVGNLLNGCSHKQLISPAHAHRPQRACVTDQLPHELVSWHARATRRRANLAKCQRI